MSSSLVIVGIPKEDDRVWKISSEKVPHLTLLHLGDVEKVANLEQIMLFVEHAASTTLRPFYLPVERRGELGDSKADVLFFRKGRYDFKAVRDFRTMLLKDSNVKTAYDATSQFELPAEVGAPGQPWIPHLTLGYPESPAKPIPDGHVDTIYDVCFDKVAVWLGDYEGPEFLLKDYWEEADEMLDNIPMDVAMSDIQHYGVKGMRWGVRKEEVSGGPAGSHIRIHNKTNVAAISVRSQVMFGVPLGLFAPLGAAAFISPRFRAEFKAARSHNKLVQQDKKWKKQIEKSKKGVEVHNRAAGEINSKIEAFNSDKRWKDSKGKDIDLTKNPAKQKEYDEAVTREVINPAYSNAAVKVYGSKSPSERYTFQVNNAATGELKMTDALAKRREEQLAGVKHAAEDEISEDITVKFTLQRNEIGHLIGMQPSDKDLIDDSVEHTVDLGAEFMAHYGVKGMRWGVNREDISRAAGSTTSTIGKAYQDVDRFTRDIEFESNTRERINPETRIREVSKAKEAVEEQGHAKFTKEDLPVIKAKPEYVKAAKLRNRLLHPRDPATKAYRKEVKAAYIKRLEEAANSMKNASGTREYTIREKGGELPGSKYSWEVTTREVKHGAVEDHTFTVEVIMDEDGFITDLKKTDESVAQSVDLGSALISDLMEDAGYELEHYGVKGMKWGVRREGFVTRQHQRKLSREGRRQEHRAPSDVRALPTIGKSRRAKAEVKTKGGEDHPPAEDAIKVASSRQKLRKSGVAALSNQELQEMQRRLNLESDVQRLLVGNRTAGQKFVDGLLGRGSKEDRKGFENQLGVSVRSEANKQVVVPAAKAAKKVVRKAATGI